jgi:hypothetical protein
VIASPRLCVTPPLVSDRQGPGRINPRIVRNTAADNFLGLCGITMPLARDRAGMPVGLQLIAPAHSEERLLAIAIARAACARDRRRTNRHAASPHPTFFSAWSLRSVELQLQKERAQGKETGLRSGPRFGSRRAAIRFCPA